MITILASLLGGVGLFLLGMWLMTEGLKVAAGTALRGILDTWTRSRLRGLAAGIGLTALVQSSSAVTVATVGFVNSGLLSLAQAISVVYGTNIGTTMTGWLVALIGVQFDVGAIALPLLGAGMLVRLLARGRSRLTGAGEAIAGFGVFFLGVGILKSTFDGVAPELDALPLAANSLVLFPVFLLLGIALTALTQSSSAAIAIALTATAGAGVPIALAAATVIGTNIGTTSTAMLAAIGATPAAKRVATAHVAFNLITGLAALLAFPVLLASAQWLAEYASAQPGAADGATTLAVFHTLFNILGVAVMWPLTPRLVTWLSQRYVEPAERLSKPKFLDAATAEVPAVALRALLREVERMRGHALEIAERSVTRLPRSAEAEHDAAAVLALGHEIRDFIGKLNRAPMADDAIHVLADFIRAVQHLEDLVAASRNGAIISDRSIASLTEASGVLVRRVQSHLAERTLVTNVDVEKLGAVRKDVEAAYDQLKAVLLHETAHAVVPLSELDRRLVEAQRLRRLVRVVVKADLRLAAVRHQLNVQA